MREEQQNVLHIRPGMSQEGYWADLWRYRELFYFLAWRDLLVRYKQTAIGIAWALLRPLLVMVVFSFVFGRLANLSSGDSPYPLMVLAGLIPWLFFSSALTDAANSLVGNASMISKIYFPRLLIPVSSITVNLFDMVLSAVMFIGLMLWYGAIPDIRIIALPVFVLMLVMLTLGVGFWVSALNVKYRDIRFVVPFFIQFFVYISPVGFSSAVVPDQIRLLYSLNPVVGIIDGFRWSLLGGSGAFYWPSFAISAVFVAFSFFAGIRFFKRTERAFADLI